MRSMGSNHRLDEIQYQAIPSMTPGHSPVTLGDIVVISAALLAWYLYQIGSRRQKDLSFRLRRAAVFLVFYLPLTIILLRQGLPLLEAVAFGFLAGIGCGWLFVTAPKTSRRIPKAVRRAVIKRDLTSKGLEWDPVKYHIDHVVPFSRGGDNSVRNLRFSKGTRTFRRVARCRGFGTFSRCERLRNLKRRLA
jgi:hypothetical protein